jgi:predicted Co/Zn/Cd cation transporter (cation efflux family)
MNTLITFTAACFMCAWFQRRSNRRVQERINAALLTFLHLGGK